ncbi:MAG: PQQ-binding-like beta-propeller repeat protein [Myxococcales bacterium]|jgi:outer membrane protein assembly factor BamB
MLNTRFTTLLTRALACTLLMPAACSESDRTGQSRGGVSTPPGDDGVTVPAGTQPPAQVEPSSGESQSATTTTGEPVAGAAGNGATPAEGNAQPDAPSGASTQTDDGSPAPVASEWRMMGYDPGSTFNNSAETLLTKENAATLRVAWQADMGGNVYGAALQVGDRIYASGPASARAFDAATGSELWSADVSSTAALAYDGGKLYAHTNTSDIVALDAETGAMLWSSPANPSDRGDGTSSPLVAGDLVLIGGSNGGIELSFGSFRGYLSALDAETGESRWVEYTVPSTAEGASIWSSPAADLEAGLAFGSTGNNYGTPTTDTSDALIAFDLQTGSILWKNQRVADDAFSGTTRTAGPDADFGANPVVYETMLEGEPTKLVSSGHKGGSACAVRADDGSLVWTRDLCPGSTTGSRGIFTNATWTGRYMLFACNEERSATLYALDGASGDIAWMRTLPGLVWGRTAVANGVGAVGAGETLEIFDADTGEVITSFQSQGGTIASTITIANGRIAFGEGLSWQSGKRGSALTVLSLP